MALEKNLQLGAAFGNRVRTLRESKGVTKQSMAYSLNIERRQLLRIESGQINTTLQMAYAIAQYFGMSLSELLDFPLG